MDVQTDAVLEAMMPNASPGNQSASGDGGPGVSEKPQKSGYPLTLMESKPDERFCCSFCRLLLREPMQNSCGHRFCRGCMEIIKTSTNVYCQACKDEDEETVLNANEMFDDVAARREMKKLSVACVSPGCLWKGTFNQYIEHEVNCEKRMFLCSQCDSYVSKAKLDEHKTNSCPKRVVTCQYCHETIVFEDTENHQKTCPKYVIKCEECSMKIERQALTEHQEKACTNRVITCPMPSCNVKCVLSQFLNHIGKESMRNEHIAFLLERVTCLDQQVLQLESRVPSETQPQVGGSVIARSLSMPDSVTVDSSPVDNQPNEVRSEGDGAHADASFQSEDRQKLKLHEDLMSVLHSEILRCINKGEALGRGMEKEEERVRNLYLKFEGLGVKISDLDKKCSAFERHVMTTLQTGELSIENEGSFLWYLPSFSELRRNACSNVQVSVSSAFFFSQPSGYKMQLTLFPDGRGPVKGKSLSLFLEIVAGPYDDLLVWPFTGKIHLMLIDQKDFRRHFVKCDRVTNPVQRPTGSERVVLGMEDFIHKEQLAKTLDKYILGDKVYIKLLVEPSAKVKERIASLDPRNAMSVN